MVRRDPLPTARDRVGSRRLRTVTLPHHRTSGFPHPAVEPGSGYPAASCHVMKPLALLPWSFHSAPLHYISSGAGLLPLGRFLQADPLLYSPLPELSRKCALGSLLDCFGKLLAPLSRVLPAGLSLGSLALRSFRLSPAFFTTTASADFCPDSRPADLPE